MKNKILFKFQTLIVLILVAFSFYRCAGTDVPWQLIQDDTNAGGGAQNPGGGGSGGQNPQPAAGCVVSFITSTPPSPPADVGLRMDLMYADKARKDNDPDAANPDPKTSRDKGKPRNIPNVTLHFNGNKVVIDSASRDFKDSIITIPGYTLTLKQKAGTKIEGTYDSATGKIEMNGALFTMDAQTEGGTTVPNISLPVFSLTTEKVEMTTTGAFQNKISETGVRLDTTGANKNLTLVGGLVLPPTFIGDSLRNAGVIIVLKGVVDTLPTAANCSGGGGGGGGGGGSGELSFYEVRAGIDGNPKEFSLVGSNNTLDFSSVFIPEQGHPGEDPVPANDERFSKTKTLRVKNGSNSDIDATLNNLAAPFSAKLNDGTVISNKVTVPKNGTIDIKVTLGYSQPVDYTTPPPETEKKTFTITGSGQTATVNGNVKRAAAELVFTNQTGDSVTTVDFGPLTTFVDGEGAASKLAVCKSVPWAVRRLSVKNIGTRGITNLQLKINDAAPTQKVECPFFVDLDGNNREFFGGMAAEPTKGNVTCSVVAGANVCNLPGGQDSQVNFDITYRPINASPLALSQNDQGTVLFPYKDDKGVDADGSKQPITLTAGVSADRSNVLKLKNKAYSFEISSGGTIKINIPKTDTSATASFILVNSLDKELKVEDVIMTDPNFVITGLAKGDTIPARTAAPKEFQIKYTKKSAETLTVPMLIKFSETGSTGISTYSSNLSGTFDYIAPTGYYEFRIDKLTAYVDHPYTKLVDSIDFRDPKLNNFKTGPILLKFVSPKGDNSSPLRSVSFGQQKVLDADKLTKPSAILSALLNLSSADRARLVRIYTTQLTKFAGANDSNEDPDGDGVPNCTDPASINRPYPEATGGECSFFYYVIQGGSDPAKPGIYDDRTGTMVLPSLKLRLMNPFHRAKADTYGATNPNPPAGTSSFMTNTIMADTTMTTLTINSVKLTSATTPSKDDYKDVWTSSDDIPLVDDTRLSAGDLALPSGILDSEILPKNRCPVGPMGEVWAPWFDKPSMFGCDVTSNSPYYIKGYPVTEKNGNYYMVVSLLTKFNSAASRDSEGNPENIPFFMAEKPMWATIHGRLVKCTDVTDPQGFEKCDSMK